MRMILTSDIIGCKHRCFKVIIAIIGDQYLIIECDGQFEQDARLQVDTKLCHIQTFVCHCQQVWRHEQVLSKCSIGTTTLLTTP